jgi:hypothetical protein
LPEIVLQEQFTFTGDVRDILMVGDQVWAATGGGLAIHRRRDGAYVKTLTSADGLPGNSLRSLALLDERHVLVGSDFAAAVVEVKDGGPSTVIKLGCENGCTRFDPVYAVAADSTGVWLLRHQSGLEHWTHNRRSVWTRASKPNAASGMWHALALSAGPVLGGLDGGWRSVIPQVKPPPVLLWLRRFWRCGRRQISLSWRPANGFSKRAPMA